MRHLLLEHVFLLRRRVGSVHTGRRDRKKLVQGNKWWHSCFRWTWGKSRWFDPRLILSRVLLSPANHVTLNEMTTLTAFAIRVFFFSKSAGFPQDPESQDCVNWFAVLWITWCKNNTISWPSRSSNRLPKTSWSSLCLSNVIYNLFYSCCWVIFCTGKHFCA